MSPESRGNKLHLLKLDSVVEILEQIYSNHNSTPEQIDLIINKIVRDKLKKNGIFSWPAKIVQDVKRLVLKKLADAESEFQRYSTLKEKLSTQEENICLGVLDFLSKNYNEKIESNKPSEILVKLIFNEITKHCNNDGLLLDDRRKIILLLWIFSNWKTDVTGLKNLPADIFKNGTSIESKLDFSNRHVTQKEFRETLKAVMDKINQMEEVGEKQFLFEKIVDLFLEILKKIVL